jgi:membrane protein required for colicin V production
MIFDGVVLAAVILSSIVAFLRGFIRECLTIVGVVGGMAASYFGGPFLTPLMRGWMGVDESLTGDKAQKLFDVIPLTLVADFCAYGLIFIVVVILLSVISHFLAAGAKKLGLGPVDRTLGVVFGIARAVVLLAILYLVPLFLFSEEDRKEWFAKDSRSHVYIESIAQWMATKIPNAPVEEKKESTQELLEKMDVLKSTGDAVNKAVEKADEAVQSMQNGNDGEKEGYRGEERETLDQLFETNQ